jgi:aarF domain-containing kinase
VLDCDPHPGNIIVRRLVPSNEPQLVILDHALYVTLSPTFRSQYAHLWKALLTLDWDEIKMVTREWGIGLGAEDLFASGVLMRPIRRKSPGNDVQGPEPPKKMNHYELSQKLKKKLANFLQDQEKWPKELVFIGRNMRIVQGTVVYFLRFDTSSLFFRK